MGNKKVKGIIAILVVISLLTAGFYFEGGGFLISEREKGAESSLVVVEDAISDQEEVLMPESSSPEQVISASRTDGRRAAELLEAIEDTDTYESTLRTILDDYYGNPGNEDKIRDLSAAIGDRGVLIAENYKNADKERKNKDNLDYATEEVLVLFEPGTGKGKMADVANDANMEVGSTGTLEIGEMTIMELPLEYTVEQGTRQLQGVKSVIAVEPNYIYRIMDETPDEPVGKQKGEIKETPDDPRLGVHLTRINAIKAWSLLPGDREKVRVAVIDTGVRATHEDLKNILNPGLSATIEGGNIRQGVIGDDNGHGTHVSGIIAAEANNGVGSAGVAAGYNPANGTSNKVVDLIVIDAYRGGFYTSDLLLSIDYAVGNGAKIINMSLGGPGHNSLIDGAVKAAADSGVLCISAAGNESTDKLVYPADAPEGMGVINTQNDGTKYSRSNYGPNKDIAAPGTSIYSTIANSDSHYGTKTGSSMSAPVVAGTAAMVLYVQPDISVKQLKNILYGSTFHSGFSTELGFGGVNAEAAVLASGNLDAVAPTDVILNQSYARLAEGNTMYLESRISPANTNLTNLTWSSSDISVARVTGGTVEGISPGTAVITATTSNGKTASCNVTVFPRYTTISSTPYTSEKSLTVDSALSTPLNYGIDFGMRSYYSYMNGYKYTGRAGEVLTLEADGSTSSGGEFDTYIKILDSDGRYMAHNDDHGGTLGSRIDYVLPKDDTYYIEVSESISGSTLQLGTITFRMETRSTYEDYSPVRQGMTLRGVAVCDGPSTSAKKIGSYKIGTLLTLNGIHTTPEGVKWYKVYHDGEYGYVYAKNVSLLSVNGYVRYSPYKRGKTLNKVRVRKTISTGASSIGTFNKNRTIRLNAVLTTAGGTKWYRVSYNGKPGYVLGRQVKLLRSPTYRAYSPKKSGTTLVAMSVRSSPSTKAKAIGRFRSGITIKLDGLYTTSSGVKWYKVYTNGKYGYIPAKNVRLK